MSHVAQGKPALRCLSVPVSMANPYFEFRNVSSIHAQRCAQGRKLLCVEQGETAVIMGRSGVGKSVSLKVPLGFLEPDEGRIVVAGEAG